MTKTLLRFILLFVVTYGVGVYAFSKINFFSSWHVFFRKSVELVVSNALPSCEIETQKFVDPVSKKFPSSDPVPIAQLEKFKEESVFLISALPAWDNADVATADTSSKDSENKN